ncbi:MAG: PilZ domain-containing protein [Acidobacteria bacterium]|nr:PilZ domain-containing protein [Acidobacteriota bacterium]
MYLNLGDDEFVIAEEGLTLQPMASARDVLAYIETCGQPEECLLVAVSRNLMKNYLALSTLFFNERTHDVTFLPVIHARHRIPPFKDFLFGRAPRTLARLDAATLDELVIQRVMDRRRFQRIPVEFVAFAAPPGADEPVPVVCRNISWDGTYFETKRDLKFEKFMMVLRSRLHKIELPARMVRKIYIDTPPRRFGYGVRFGMPLPLTLIQYMFMKYMKDTVVPVGENTDELAGS